MEKVGETRVGTWVREVEYPAEFIVKRNLKALALEKPDDALIHVPPYGLFHPHSLADLPLEVLEAVLVQYILEIEPQVKREVYGKLAEEQRKYVEELRRKGVPREERRVEARKHWKYLVETRGAEVRRKAQREHVEKLVETLKEYVRKQVEKWKPIERKEVAPPKGLVERARERIEKLEKAKEWVLKTIVGARAVIAKPPPWLRVKVYFYVRGPVRDKVYFREAVFEKNWRIGLAIFRRGYLHYPEAIIYLAIAEPPIYYLMLEDMFYASHDYVAHAIKDLTAKGVLTRTSTLPPRFKGFFAAPTELYEINKYHPEIEKALKKIVNLIGFEPRKVKIKEPIYEVKEVVYDPRTRRWKAVRVKVGYREVEKVSLVPVKIVEPEKIMELLRKLPPPVKPEVKIKPPIVYTPEEYGKWEKEFYKKMLEKEYRRFIYPAKRMAEDVLKKMPPGSKLGDAVILLGLTEIITEQAISPDDVKEWVREIFKKMQEGKIPSMPPYEFLAKTSFSLDRMWQVLLADCLFKSKHPAICGLVELVKQVKHGKLPTSRPPEKIVAELLKKYVEEGTLL